MARNAAWSHGLPGLHRLVLTHGTTGAPWPMPFPVIERKPPPITYSNSFQSHSAKCCGERRAITVPLASSTGVGRWRQTSLRDCDNSTKRAYAHSPASEHAMQAVPEQAMSQKKG